MPSPLSVAGAASDPSRYAPIHVKQMFTGLVTNRSPLREGAVPFLYQKFYAAARFDSLLDGANLEISSRLTLVRRPGNSVYNSRTFPAIQRFFDWRTYCANSAPIRVLADTASIVYDATGPNTQLALFRKSAGAGPTFFAAIAGVLYMVNGVDAVKLRACGLDVVEGWGIAAPATAPQTAPLAYLGAPTRYWAAGMHVVPGYTILDANGNIQLMTGSINSSQTLVQTIQASVVVRNGWAVGAQLGDYEPSQQGHQYPPLGFNTPYDLANDISPTQPYANATLAFDGSPDTAATCQFDGTHKYAGCVWGFQYSGPAATKITLNVLSEVPPGVGGRFRDAAIFYSLDNGTTWTKLYQSPQRTKRWDSADIAAATTINNILVMAFLDSHDHMAHSVFEINLVVSRGSVSFDLTQGSLTTGTQLPAWNQNVFGATLDGTAIWTNVGPPSQWKANTVYALTSPTGAVLDSNGNLQTLQTTGVSGATVPVWATNAGDTTTDGTAVWLNTGPGTTLAVFGWSYGYGFRNSLSGVTGHTSTMSPASVTTGPVIGLPFGQNGSGIAVSGGGTTDGQVDTVRLYRTTDGGSLFLFNQDAANPGGGGTWTLQDRTVDADLNELIQAAAGADAHENDPPPAGMTAPEFHRGRIFAIVGNSVVYTRTRSALDGNPLEAFPPENIFGPYPSRPVRLWSSTIGLVVFTDSDPYIITGAGTAADPFDSPGTFLKGYGLLHYDAFTVNGATAHFLAADRTFIALDPGAGVIEPGFPIGDRFSALYDPAAAYVTWHRGGSGDTACYVSDGAVGWFRMSAASAPESGIIWSPRAVIEGGTSAVQSVTTAPGVRDLLIGPASSGPILRRDPATHRDGNNAYAGFDVIGSIVLAEPGQVAEVEFVAHEAQRVGQRPKVALLLDEIAGEFEALPRLRREPPLLPESTSLYRDRHWLANQQPAYCRHLLLRHDWAREDVASELLSYTIFGAVHNEKKS